MAQSIRVSPRYPWLQMMGQVEAMQEAMLEAMMGENRMVNLEDSEGNSSNFEVLWVARSVEHGLNGYAR